ncbi:spermatogenesis-associated protein 46 [Microtus ochrogaster]|uniref:Spermatogenesis-associated protein 46 n=1 Tax=Microtus ochrogaster TaxID=79684 RepID=A0ABM1U1A7_MICOH|nr:spermatogenesis-associated protein 46 [Microtus ochrogaster]
MDSWAVLPIPSPPEVSQPSSRWSTGLLRLWLPVCLLSLTASRHFNLPSAPNSDPALSFADLRDSQNGEQLRRNCTIYRPWFSPYSYFVCTDKESHLEAYGFPEVDWEEGRGDTCFIEDVTESVCSSSSSQEKTFPREANRKSMRGLESITSQDILMASKWHPAQQNGYKCAACCRMYPTLHSLKSHIKGGFKEGFSCKVYYRKLKAFWGKEQKARPGDRLSLGSC